MKAIEAFSFRSPRILIREVDGADLSTLNFQCAFTGEPMAQRETAENVEQRTKERILFWISTNPGRNARQVAEGMGLDDVDVIELTEQMLNAGQLDFAG